MPPTPSHPRQTIELARDLYRQGMKVRDICAKTGMSVGTLYYHLDGLSLPGAMPPRLPRRRDVMRGAEKTPSRGRRRLAARLFRAAEQQARKIELTLAIGFQRKEDRTHDLAALRELTRILRDLATLEEASARAEERERRGGTMEREEALAVEGRAVFVRRQRG